MATLKTFSVMGVLALAAACGAPQQGRTPGAAGEAANGNSTNGTKVTANLAGPAPATVANDVLNGGFAALQGWDKKGDVATLDNDAIKGSKVVRLTFDGNQATSITQTFDLSSLKGTRMVFQYNAGTNQDGVLKTVFSYSTNGGEIKAGSPDTGTLIAAAQPQSGGFFEEPFVEGMVTKLTLSFIIDGSSTPVGATSAPGAKAGGYADIGNLTISTK